MKSRLRNPKRTLRLFRRQKLLRRGARPFFRPTVQQLEDRRMLAFGLPAYVSIADSVLNPSHAGNDQSIAPGRGTLSADGRYQVFASHAGNLVTGDSNGTVDVFLRDLETGTTTLVSHASSSTNSANSASDSPVISADGNWVAFRSGATNLTALDTAPFSDIFIWERQTGLVSLISVNVAGDNGNDGFSDQPAISGDGKIVAYRSTGTNLSPLDTDGTFDVYVRNRVTNTTLLMSVNSGGTAAGNDESIEPIVSSDGRSVAFRSRASDLTSSVNDNNANYDIFVRDVGGTVTTLITTEVAGALAGNDHSENSRNSISADGSYQVFFSYANDLVAGDKNGTGDVFLRDLVSGTTTLVSRAVGSTRSGNSLSDQPVISADGDWVAFRSFANNLISTDTNGGTGDIFVWQRGVDDPSVDGPDTLGVISVVSVNSLGGQGNGDSESPAISADGSSVAFRSFAANLAQLGIVDNNGAADIFLRDRQAQTTELVSVNGFGVTSGNGPSFAPVISADGSTVGFTSRATNLDATVTDNNDAEDAFVRQGGTTRLINRDLAGDFSGNKRSTIGLRSISGDGRYEVFTSDATNLSALDSNGTTDVYFRDLQNNEVRLVSRNFGNTGAGDFASDLPVISADGAYVAYRSFATDLVSGASTSGYANVYLWSRVQDETTLISHQNGQTLTGGDNNSSLFSYEADPQISISEDGSRVAYSSFASDLVAVDNNNNEDIFQWNRSSNTNTLVSVNSAGTGSGNDASFHPAISADGTSVTFLSNATNLDAAVNDTNNEPDVFIRRAGATRLITRGISGAQTGTGTSTTAERSVSADGRYVVFTSDAPDLVPGVSDGNETNDIYLRDLLTDTTVLVSHAAGSLFTAANATSSQPVISADGNWVAFVSHASDLDPSISNPGHSDIYRWSRASGLVARVTISGDGDGSTDADSDTPTISANGQYIAFRSDANRLDLSTPEFDSDSDIFRRDMTAGETRLVSRNTTGDNGGDSFSYEPKISPDGQAITFTSSATNLDGSMQDNNGTQDVFLWQMGTPPSLKLVSRALPSDAGNGASNTAPRSVSADGRYEVFTSFASNLVVDFDDNNGEAGADIFLRDLENGEIYLVSRALAGPAIGGNEHSFDPVISADGNFVAFVSRAGDLTFPAACSGTNVYLWERPPGPEIAGLITLVSVSFTGTCGNGDSDSPSISDDDEGANGLTVAFRSAANNLDGNFAGENNGGQAATDIYVRTGLISSPQTRLISVNRDQTSSGNRASSRPVLSGDGEMVTFQSLAFDLDGQVLDRNFSTDIFVRSVAAPYSDDSTMVTTSSADGTVSGNRSSEANRRSVSADGRYEVFASDANDLVVNDANGLRDIFWRDNETGEVLLVSQNFAGTASGSHASDRPVISADGEWVAFVSNANDLVTPNLDTNSTSVSDVFVWQRPAVPGNPGIVTLVSLSSAGAQGGLFDGSDSPSISADGQFIAFRSDASLHPFDATPTPNSDVYVRDVQSGTTTLISTRSDGFSSGNAGSFSPVISAGGSAVAFVSEASDLVTVDTNGSMRDVFVRNVAGGAVELVSATAGGISGNSDSDAPNISADGNLIVFHSFASNFVDGVTITDSNNSSDVFLRNRSGLTTTLVSVNSTGTASGNFESIEPLISGNGSTVTFRSLATNLDGTLLDRNGTWDVFMRSTTGGPVRLVSAAFDDGVSRFSGNNFSETNRRSVSADGRYTVFTSFAADLVANDTNFASDVFLRDNETGAIFLVSHNAAGTSSGNSVSDEPVISADGNWVAFRSDSDDLVAGNADANFTSDVYVWQRSSGAITLVSVDTVEVQGNDYSRSPSINDNGQFIAFLSGATNLSALDTNMFDDVFVRDRVAGTTVLISVHTVAGANGGHSFGPVISGNGNAVAFVSRAADLVPGDTNGAQDIFVKNVVGGSVEVASRRPGGSAANGDSFLPDISRDGNLIAFESLADNLVDGVAITDTNLGSDVFVRNRLANTTTLISVNRDGNGSGTEFSSEPVISADSGHVAFVSEADDLVAGDEFDPFPQVFVRSAFGGPTIMVSVNNSGEESNGFSYEPSISDDGLHVAFLSNATNLNPAVSNFLHNIYLRDLVQQTTTLLSTDSGITTGGNNFSYRPIISGNGAVVTWNSEATNLDESVKDLNNTQDVFVYDPTPALDLPVTQLISRRLLGPRFSANGASDQPAISFSGNQIAFRSFASDLMLEDRGFHSDVFLYNRDGDGNGTPDEPGDIETELVSITAAGFSANRESNTPALSGDGSTVVFNSSAFDLDAAVLDLNNAQDVFVRREGNTTHISRRAEGPFVFSASGDSDSQSISEDGRRIAYRSSAYDIFPLDFNFLSDVFVYDRDEDGDDVFDDPTTILVSTSSFSFRTADGSSDQPIISANGEYVAFRSDARDLVILGGFQHFASDVYRRDLSPGGATELVSVDTTGNSDGVNDSDQPSISGDGRWVAFRSYTPAPHFTGEPVTEEFFSSDVFARDMALGTTTLVSVNPAGNQVGNRGSQRPVINEEGTVVVFESLAFNLVAGLVDANGVFDVFARDLVAEETQLVSASAASGGSFSANGMSYEPVIARDALGNVFVAYTSSASDLAMGDVNFTENDVYLYDNSLLATELISITSQGTGGNAGSDSPSISPNGRYVAFSSSANDLAAPDTNFHTDVFVRDRGTITPDVILPSTTLVSVNLAGDDGGTGFSGSPVIAVNPLGEVIVAFESTAFDLVATEDDDFFTDIFVRNLSQPNVTLVSANASNNGSGNDESSTAVLSADGSTVAFNSYSTNLISGFIDLNDSLDVFARDLDAGVTEVVSMKANSGGGVFSAAEASFEPVISANGLIVAFTSYAPNLVAIDGNGFASDVFVYDWTSDDLELLSINDAGTSSGNGHSDSPSISASGRYIAFRSGASNLVAGDDNPSSDVFVRDRGDAAIGPSTTLVSVALDGTSGNGDSDSPSISASGEVVAFRSNATDLVTTIDGNSVFDVFARDLFAGTTTLVSVSGDGTTAGNGESYTPVISDAGGTVTFNSRATDLDSLVTDANGVIDVFARILSADTTFLVSRKATGAFSGSSGSTGPVLSADGRYAAFSTESGGLAEEDSNELPDVYRFDSAAGSTGLNTLVSQNLFGVAGNAGSDSPSISADGRYIAFRSYATDLAAPDSTSHSDIFRRDLGAAIPETILISVDIDNGGGANGFSDQPQISADGNIVVFRTEASNLSPIDFNGFSDVYARNVSAELTTLVSISLAGDNGGDNDSGDPQVSASGEVVVFNSRAANLAPEVSDLNQNQDVYARELADGSVTQLVSIRGAGTFSSDGFSESHSISADGRRIAYASYARELVLNDFNNLSDVYVFDRDLNETILVSANFAGTSSGDSGSVEPVISGNGQFVAFTSAATDLSLLDTNGNGLDVFRRELAASSTELVSQNSDGSGSGDEYSFTPSINSEGSIVAFVSFSSNLVAGLDLDSPYGQNVFARDFAAGVTALLSRVGSSLARGDGYSRLPLVSADGSTVTFASFAPDLVPGVVDDNSAQDLFAVQGATISVTDVSVVEGDAGTTVLTFLLRLSPADPLEAVTVDVITTNNTAIAPQDYFPAGPTTIVFEPGQTQQPVVITVRGDLLVEGNESFFLNLSSPVNAILARSQAVGTILDDDAAIRGQKFNDLDGDGVRDPNELGLNDWLIRLFNNADPPTPPPTPVSTQFTHDIDLNGDTVIDPFTERGWYVFTGLDAATYRVEEQPQVGWTQTAPVSGAHIFAIAGGETATGKDFGNAQSPTLSVNDVAIAEGNAGLVDLVFTVSLSRASTQTITVRARTADNAATIADQDYVALDRVLTFNPNELTQQVIVQVRGDTKFELNDSFFLNLSEPTNIEIADGQGQGTITNDDAVPTISISDVSHDEGNSGQTQYEFSVSLSNASYLPITVNYQAANGTATAADADFAPANGTLNFAAGSTTNQTLTVQVNGDLKHELTETFDVTLSGASNAQVAAGAAGIGTGTIVNDDSTPTISINDITLAEGNSGTTTFQFAVTLSNPSYLPISASVQATNGSATTADLDFLPNSSPLNIPAGSTTGQVTVLVVGDTKHELDESFDVILSNPTNADLASGNAGIGTGTIINDDAVPTISIIDLSLNEGNSGQTPFPFAVSLSNPSYLPISVNYQTANGTALVGDNDYQTLSGTLNIPAGSAANQTITIQVTGDVKHELSETFDVALSNATNASIAGAGAGIGTGTITNDDAVPTLTISDVSLSEGNAGQTAFQFSVSLSNPSYLPISVSYQANDGSAFASDLDYVPASGTVNFATGSTAVQPIVVQVNGDLKPEQNETFDINLSAPTNATVANGGAGIGTGTITNDDPFPTSISIDDVQRVEGNSGTVDLVFTVTLSQASTQQVTVDYATADGTATGLVVNRVVSGLTRPVFVTTPAGDMNRLFILEQHTGQIRIFDRTAGTLLATPFLTISGVSTGNEQGLLGLAFHPNYATNGFFYVNYTEADGDTRVRRFTRSAGNSNVADSASGIDVLTIDQPQTNHNGGWIGFGPNGYLYIASGDGGSANDQGTGHTEPGGNALDITDNLLGKMLRVDVNGDDFPTETARNYAIPTNNPFVGVTGDDEIWAYGLRNPWRPAFDAETGDLWIADVGQDALEEVNFQPSRSAGGENYGWRLREGTIATPGNVGGPKPAGAIDPIYEYPHGGGQFQGDSVTGGYVYRGPIPELTGQYFFGDNVNEEIWSLRFAGGNPSTFNGTQFNSRTDWTTLFAPSTGSIDLIASFGEDPDGNLFIVDLGGEIYQVSSGGDYDPASGQLIFPAGQTTRTITIKGIGDVLDEPNETFFVNLSNATGGAGIQDAQGLGTITDDDDTPTVSLTGAASVTETNSALDVFYDVSLSNPRSVPIQVDVSAVALTASSLGDYQLIGPTTVIFSPGESFKRVAVRIVGDYAIEPDEQFRLELQNAQNATIGTGQVVVTIANDDMRTLSVSDAQIVEGNPGDDRRLTFTVTLSQAIPEEVTVNVSTSSDTATNGQDYEGLTNVTVTIPANQPSATFQVLVNEDSNIEANESFFVTLSGPSENAALGDAGGTGTITNDDVNRAPTLDQIADPAAIAEDALVQTVNLTGISAGAGETQLLTVTVASSNLDLIPQPSVTYTSPNSTGSLTYRPAANRSGTAQITVTVKDDGGTVGGGVDTFVRTFTVTVNAVNDAPTIVLGPTVQATDDGSAQSLPGWATGISPGPTDEAGQTLNISTSANNSSLFIVQPQVDLNGNLTFTPAPNVAGSATVTVTLTDNGQTANAGVDTTVQTFQINITKPNPWFNARNRLDVNDSRGTSPVSALDALIIFNALNAFPGSLPTGSVNDNGNFRILPSAPMPNGPSIAVRPFFYDASHDNFISALDALLVINFINSAGTGEGEAASASNSELEALDAVFNEMGSRQSRPGTASDSRDALDALLAEAADPLARRKRQR